MVMTATTTHQGLEPTPASIRANVEGNLAVNSSPQQTCRMVFLEDDQVIYFALCALLPSFLFSDVV